LELERQRGDDRRVAETLLSLSDVNRLLGLHEEGIRQTREALRIFERTANISGQAACLECLAWLFFRDNQLDAAEDAASRAIDLVSGKDQEHIVCQLHRVLGKIHGSKREKMKAIPHFDTALGIASPPNWREQLFWIHFDMAELFRNVDEFEHAHDHIECAKSYAADNSYQLGCTIHIKAQVLYLQHRLEDAKSEASLALEIFEKSGAPNDAGNSRTLLQQVEEAMEKKNQPTSFRGELLDTLLHLIFVNFYLASVKYPLQRLGKDRSRHLPRTLGILYFRTWYPSPFSFRIILHSAASPVVTMHLFYPLIVDSYHVPWYMTSYPASRLASSSYPSLLRSSIL
jgi:tetratricopeptide (TPR) repeat protein